MIAFIYLFIFKEVTVGELPDGDQTMIQSLEFSVPHFRSPERGQELEMELMIICLHHGGSIKIPEECDLENFQVREDIHTLGGYHTTTKYIGTEAPLLGTHLDLTICISLSGCSSVPLITSFILL